MSSSRIIPSSNHSNKPEASEVHRIAKCSNRTKPYLLDQLCEYPDGWLMSIISWFTVAIYWLPALLLVPDHGVVSFDLTWLILSRICKLTIFRILNHYSGTLVVNTSLISLNQSVAHDKTGSVEAGYTWNVTHWMFQTSNEVMVIEQCVPHQKHVCLRWQKSVMS